MNSLPMMIFAKVDDAGLSLAEFRLLAHICRRVGSKANGRACDCGISSMARSCRMNEKTTRKALRALIAAGWVKEEIQLGKASVLHPQSPPENNADPSQDRPGVDEWEALLNPSQDRPGVGGGHPSQKVVGVGGPDPSQDRPLPKNGTPTKIDQGTPPKRGQGKGYRKGNKKKCSTSSGESERGLKFADWFRQTLPEKIRLQANWRNNFAKCFDAMTETDHRDPQEIHSVCRWARNDDFWSANFLSPAKLRKRNRDGVLYYDVFLAKLNRPTNHNGTTNHRLAKEAREFPKNATQLPTL